MKTPTIDRSERDLVRLLGFYQVSVAPWSPRCGSALGRRICRRTTLTNTQVKPLQEAGTLSMTMTRLREFHSVFHGLDVSTQENLH
jgi:hypothetical protein